MLHSEHRCGCQHGDLSVVARGSVDSAHGHLRLAKPDVTAHETIHWRRLINHVSRDVVKTLLLVACRLVFKPLFEGIESAIVGKARRPLKVVSCCIEVKDATSLLSSRFPNLVQRGLPLLETLFGQCGELWRGRGVSRFESRQFEALVWWHRVLDLRVKTKKDVFFAVVVFNLVEILRHSLFRMNYVIPWKNRSQPPKWADAR
mmetsp:Transcript_55718/g.111717  ORF Transcript_55718/g.111717 Transcript_55718/m.111717 type:complete len:203 (-) Transcript_55718:272-880(-)